MRPYLIGGKYMGCNYVRLLLPMFENGWEGNYYGLMSGPKDHKTVAEEIKKADVVVFHRPELAQHHMLGMQLKKMGKKIVFDNDDTFNLDEYHPFFELSKGDFERSKQMKNNVVNNFILNSDLVTCSTEFLKKEYEKINPNVVVLPNCIEPKDWEEPLRNEGDKIRIGFVGSVVYAHDFETIKPTIKKLSEDPRFEIIVFGLNKISEAKKHEQERTVLHKEYEFWEGINMFQVPWVPQYQYFHVLNELRLDMMLIPRRENNFNRAKSNIKFLEAAMCEIPVIASSFSTKDSPYDKDINGKNGLLVGPNDDWMAAIETLMDKKTRRKMGKEAKKYALKHYSISNNAHRWVDAYKTLF